MTYDPGMDQAPDVWQSPEISPTFPEVPHDAPSPEDDRDPVGRVEHFPDARKMHDESIETLRASNAALVRLIEQQMMVGFEIFRLDANAAAVFSSQRIRFRVQQVIVNPVTAGTLILQIGETQYPFNAPANGLQPIPFPLVIERGVNMACVGNDGRIYLVGIPE